MNSRESSKRGRKHSCRLISHSKTTLLTLSFMLTFSLPSLLELFKLLDIKSRSHCVIFLFLTDVFPPTILSFSNKTVYKKTTVKLRCRISAYPAPTVQWFKDGTSLEVTQVTIGESDSCESRKLLPGFYQVDNYVGQLLICSPSHADQTGFYTCQATNRDGTSSATAFLDVLGKD